MLALTEEDHGPMLQAIAQSPAGLVSNALSLAGVGWMAFWQWLRQPGNVAKLATIGLEFYTAPLQAVKDLAALLTGG